MRNSDINALVNCAIPLIVATKNCEEQTVARLLSEGAEVDAGAGAGEITALYVATHMNHIGIATLLLKAGAGANRAHHQHGGAALHLAAQAGYDELAELLLQYRADPNARTNVEGYTALDYAVQANHPKLVRLLLDKQANPDLKNKVDGGTPLHHAAANNNVAIAIMLLQAGANVKAANQLGNTPLHTAAEQNHLLMAELLLKHNAKIVNQPASLTQRTPLQVAVDNNHFAMASLLVRYGAKLSGLFYPLGSTPLHYYISKGDVEKTQWLLAHGANLNQACDIEGLYPMALAHQLDNTEILNVLLRHQANISYTRLVDLASNTEHPLINSIGLTDNLFIPAYNPHADSDMRFPANKDKN